MNELNQTIIHATKTLDLEFCIYSLNYSIAKNSYDRTRLTPLIDGYNMVKRYNYDLVNYTIPVETYKKVRYKYDFVNNKLNFDSLNNDQI
jgi:hypothetical protein